MKRGCIVYGFLALALMGTLPAVSSASEQQVAPSGVQASVQGTAQENLFAEHIEKIQRLENQLFVKHQELRALQNASQPNVGAVAAKAQEIGGLRNNLDKLRQETVAGAGAPCPSWGGHFRGYGYGRGNGMGYGYGRGCGYGYRAGL